MLLKRSCFAARGFKPLLPSIDAVEGRFSRILLGFWILPSFRCGRPLLHPVDAEFLKDSYVFLDSPILDSPFSPASSLQAGPPLLV